MKANKTYAEELQNEIERTSLSEVLSLIAGICLDKAEEKRIGHFPKSANEWNKAGEQIMLVTNRVNV
jgi:hypothetical protein